MQDVIPSSSDLSTRKRLLLLGDSGTIGRATLAALLTRGHEVVCLLRDGAGERRLPEAAILRFEDVTDADALSAAFRLA